MAWLEVTEEILVCLSNGMLVVGDELCDGPLSNRQPRETLSKSASKTWLTAFLVILSAVGSDPGIEERK
jgi:hypothetical protein